jgi:hypothetical protein
MQRWHRSMGFARISTLAPGRPEGSFENSNLA